MLLLDIRSASQCTQPCPLHCAPGSLIVLLVPGWMRRNGFRRSALQIRLLTVRPARRSHEAPESPARLWDGVEDAAPDLLRRRPGNAMHVAAAESETSVMLQFARAIQISRRELASEYSQRHSHATSWDPEWGLMYGVAFEADVVEAERLEECSNFEC